MEFLVTFTEAEWAVRRQKMEFYFVNLVQGTKRLHAICCPAWERRGTQVWIGLLSGKQLKHEAPRNSVTGTSVLRQVS